MQFGSRYGGQRCEVMVERSMVRNTFDVYFRWLEHNGDSGYIKEIVPGVITRENEGTIIAMEPLSLSEDVAQNLMDELWRAGIRPVEGHGSAGAYTEVKDSLKDARAIRDRLLVLVEKGSKTDE